MRKNMTVPLLLLFVLAAPFAGAAKNAQVESRWQGTPLKIDGEIGDWLAPAFQIEKSVQVSYAFGNDAENLYLIFIFKDPKFISSLARTGITVWFNEEGKKKKKFGLHFEKKSLAAADLLAVMEKKSGPLSEEKKKEILAKPAYIINQFRAVDGDNEDQTERVFKQPPFPEYTSVSGSGRTALEFRIPLALGSALTLAPGKAVTVGFEWGGMTKEMRQELMQRGGYEGGEATDMTETPDLDPEGSADPGGYGLPSMRRGPKRYSFWCDLTLVAGGK